EWTGVHVITFRTWLNSEDRILNVKGEARYQLSNCIVEATDEVSFGMTEEGKAQFKRRKQEVNAAKQGGFRICSSDGSIVYGIARTMPEGAEWTGVSEPTFRKRLNSEDGILNLNGKPLYQLSNCIVEATDEVSFGMTEEGKAQFKRRKQEVNAAKQGGYRICSSDGSIVYGIARTMPEGAEWTGTSEPTFRRRLNSEDRFLNVKGGARYQLSNCVVEATDEVSFGMTEEGKAQFKRRKQEVKKQKSKKKRSFNTLDPSAILDTDSSGRKRVKTQDDSDGGLASKLDSSEKDEATSDVNERLVSITKSLISLKEKGTGRKLSEIFSEKPCHTTYPDYYQLIEKPIGMNDILRKCRAKLYSSVTEFRDDWNTLFTNCVTYNGEGTWITIDAGVLKAEFNRLMDKNKEVTQARNCP
ncbi:SNF2/RAD54 helicase family protein, partial [Skeletonema marinoi]